MNIREDVKAQYDVIAEKVNGKVVVTYNPNGVDVKGSYDTVYEFMEDTNKKGLKGQVFENING